LFNSCLRYQDVTKSIDTARVQLDEQLRANFIDPISKHLGQYKDIKNRLEELDVRRVDMDRYGRDVRNANEKGKSTVPHKEQKYDTAKMNYDNLHNELSHDLPALHDDRIPFFDPTFATFVFGLHDFYKNSTNALTDVTPMVKHVNRNNVHDHPRITTSPESSYSQHKGTATNPPGGANSYTPGTTSTPAYNPASSYNPTTTPTYAPSTIPTSTPPTSSSVTGKVLPTRPMPSSQPVKAQAQFDFAAQESNELSFKNGDILLIHKQNGEWWEGELNGNKGLLPSNYVQLLP